MRGNRGRTANDERRPRFVDENRIHFVNNREEITPLHLRLDAGGHAVVAEVVEAKFRVGAICDIADILRPPKGRRLIVLDAANRQPEKLVHLAHPLRIARGEIIVNRDQMDVASECVQVERQCGNECLALTCGHFRNLALMQHDTTKNLDVKRYHVPFVGLAAHRPFFAAETATRVFHRGERFRQEIVGGRALSKPFPELFRFSTKLFIGEFLVFSLDFIHAIDQRPETLYFALVLRTQKFFQYPTNHTDSLLRVIFPALSTACPPDRADTSPGQMYQPTILADFPAVRQSLLCRPSDPPAYPPRRPYRRGQLQY